MFQYISSPVFEEKIFHERLLRYSQTLLSKEEKKNSSLRFTMVFIAKGKACYNYVPVLELKVDIDNQKVETKVTKTT